MNVRAVGCTIHGDKPQQCGEMDGRALLKKGA